MKKWRRMGIETLKSQLFQKEPLSKKAQFWSEVFTKFWIKTWKYPLMINWNIPRIGLCHRQDSIEHIWASLMQTCLVYCLANREIHWVVVLTPETALIAVSRVAIEIPISSPSFLCDCFVHLLPLSKFRNQLRSQSGERVQEREIVGRSDYATKNFVINGAKRNTNADEKCAGFVSPNSAFEGTSLKSFFQYLLT